MCIMIRGVRTHAQCECHPTLCTLYCTVGLSGFVMNMNEAILLINGLHCVPPRKPACAKPWAGYPSYVIRVFLRVYTLIDE